MNSRSGGKPRFYFLVGSFALATVGLSSFAWAEAPMGRVGVESPLRAVDGPGHGPITVLALDESAYSAVKSAKVTRLTDFVLGEGRLVDLEVRPIEVFAENAQIVLTTATGDVELPKPDVVLLSGHVADDPHSQAFLALSPYGSHGIIRLAGETFIVSSGLHERGDGPVVYNLTNLPPGMINWIDFKCGTNALPVPPEYRLNPRPEPASDTSRDSPPPRRALIAVETDFEYTEDLFGGDPGESGAYVATLFGAVSDIYTRDFNVRLQVGFLRLWSDNTDPWGQSDMGSQLVEFKDYWNTKMTHVDRHLAHYLSGRPLGGGVAYVPGLCNTWWDYGLSSLSGYFPYPLEHNHPQNWDPYVVAHEMGHNFWAPHTHGMDPPIDGCGLDPQDCSVTPNGTIMSYCHGCDGGMTNIRLEFHSRIINERVLPYLDSVSCDLSPVLSPAPEPGGPACGVADDCTGAYEGADCVAGVCYIPKNRYLSIDPTVNDLEVAYQVELIEAADYPTAVGRTWWVGEPACYGYPNGDVVTPPPPTCEGADRFAWVSKLTSTPVTRIWTEAPLHLSDCAVAPVVTYAIRASSDDGATFSDSLEIGTAHNPAGDAQTWGDVTGGPVPGMAGLWLPPDGATNFADVGNAIRTFENDAESTGSPPRVWVDVEINQVINLADVQFIVNAFEGMSYADLADLEFIGTHPEHCP